MAKLYVNFTSIKLLQKYTNLYASKQKYFFPSKPNKLKAVYSKKELND